MQDGRQYGVAEGCDSQGHGEPVQPGVIAADDQPELMKNNQSSGDGGNRLRSKQRKRNNHLDEMAEQHGKLVHEQSEEQTSELQSPCNLVCRLLLEKKKKKNNIHYT